MRPDYYCKDCKKWFLTGEDCDCMRRKKPEPKPYTAADLAKAREEGRRELADKIKSVAKLNPAGEEFWSERRDVYIIGADHLDALLEKEEGE